MLAQFRKFPLQVPLQAWFVAAAAGENQAVAPLPLYE